MALGTVSGLGREFWPHRRNPGPTQKERVSLSLLLQRAGQPAHREEAGPVMWLELGRLGQEAESGRPPGERLEVEHMRFSVSAPTDPAGCMGAGIFQLEARSGAARAGDTDHGEA